MHAYEELIVSYWELPEESQALVVDLNRFWGPGRLPADRWLAYIGDRPVGKVLVSFAGSPAVAAVYGMSVRPEARGQGIAKGLTTIVLQRAQERGCHRVALHSSAMRTNCSGISAISSGSPRFLSKHTPARPTTL